MADDDVDLDCPVCLEPYNLELREPKVLSCSGAHELCQACALKMRCDGSVGGRDIKCPHCRETISAGRPINTNRGLVAALKQKANAEEERNQLKADAAAAKAEAAAAQAAAARAREAAVMNAEKASQRDEPTQQSVRPPNKRRRRREREDQDPFAAEAAAVRQQTWLLVIGALVLLIAVSIGLWVGRRSNAEYVTQVSYSEAENKFMSKAKRESYARNLQSQADVQMMTTEEMINYLSLSTDLERNKDDPYGDGDQSEHKVLSPEGNALRSVWSSGADYAEVVQNSMIHRLCLLGSVQSVERLIHRSEGAELPRLLEKRVSVLRVTPLMATVTARRFLPEEALRRIPASNHIQIARLLLEAGARTEARDLAGHTAFLKAVGDFPNPTSWAIAKEILMAGGDINARNRFGETALMRRTCVDPGDGLGSDVNGEALPDMAVWLVASGANLDLGAFGHDDEFMKPRDCPPVGLMRMILFAEMQRKRLLATGEHRRHLERQMAKGIEVGPGLLKYERGGSGRTTRLKEEKWQDTFDKMLPQIESFVHEAGAWKLRMESVRSGMDLT